MHSANLSCLAQLLRTTPAWFVCDKNHWKGEPLLPRPIHRTYPCLVWLFVKKLIFHLKCEPLLPCPTHRNYSSLVCLFAKKKTNISLKCFFIDLRFFRGGVPPPQTSPASFSERAGFSCLAQLIGTTPAWCVCLWKKYYFIESANLSCLAQLIGTTPA